MDNKNGDQQNIDMIFQKLSDVPLHVQEYGNLNICQECLPLRDVLQTKLRNEFTLSQLLILFKKLGQGSTLGPSKFPLQRLTDRVQRIRKRGQSVGEFSTPRRWR